MMKKRNTRKTRQIWINHFGKIPVDQYGFAHEIHHIDGNPSNDNIDNLICLTIHEHYEIHYWQEDWAACSVASKRLEVDPEERRELARRSQRQRVEEGRNNFSGGELQRQRVDNGTHHLLGGTIQSASNKRRWDDGTHVLIGENQRRLDAGTHNFQNQTENQKKKILEASTVSWVCEYCGLHGKGKGMFSRWGHSDGSCLKRINHKP
jgi:hypothetical protein